MREEFLHFLWQSSLFEVGQWLTTENEEISVVSPGVRNHDAGPDFLNARIRIGEKLWAGHVEFHVNEADWFAHGHHNDKAYSNVILHIVLNKNAVRPTGFPTWIATRFVPGRYLDNWQVLQRSKERIPCSNLIREIDLGASFGWTDRLAVHRMERKASDVIKKLTQNGGDFREAFYHMLLRYFGFKVNNEAFEMLADSLPMKVLEKHSNSIIQIEALLFGQAGFLPEVGMEEYEQLLIKEYALLRRKFNLEPLKPSVWKFSRLMPGNFPTIRLAQLAAIIHSQQSPVSRISEATDLKQLRKMFSVPVSEYWSVHYHFGKISKARNEHIIGKISVDLLIINVVVPFNFVFGKQHNNQERIDKAISFLEELEPENNAVIRMWKSLNILPKNALDSQGLLELKNEYCNRKQCLNCRLGQQIIRST